MSEADAPSIREAVESGEWELREVTRLNGNGTLGTSLPRDEIELSSDDRVAVREKSESDGYDVYVL